MSAAPTYYPAFLRIDGRPCLVIGGGGVAERKVSALIDAGATVTVIAPRLAPGLLDLVDSGTIRHRARRYESGDLRGFVLAFAATDDEDLHAVLAREAEAEGVLLNVVDRPEHCGFIVPSVLSRGDLTVAVSTRGASPAFAARVRRDIDRLLGVEYDRALRLLSVLRRTLAERTFPDRQRIFAELLGSDLIESLREPDTARIDELLARHVAPTVSLAGLGVNLDKRDLA